MTSIAVTTKETISARDLGVLLAAEWEGMRKLKRGATDADVAATELLALSPTELYDIAIDPRPMGFALTGAAFLIAVKFIVAHVPAAKLGEVVLATAAKELLLEALRRVRKKRGSDYLTHDSRPPTQE